LADATYTLTYTAINPMTSGGSFKVTYPPDVTFSGTFATCTVTHSTGTYTMTGCTSSGSDLFITTGFTPNVAAGDSISINIGLITNP